MRREWIEITSRNVSGIIGKSPSMRREWIEMQDVPAERKSSQVSLHAEGVD